MNELYELIEAKIKNAGYPGEIDGREFYNDVSAEADDKENGTYSSNNILMADVEYFLSVKNNKPVEKVKSEELDCVLKILNSL